MSDIEVIKTSLLEQIANAEDAKALDEARVAALGKKGQITELLKTLGSMPMEERVSFGKKEHWKRVGWMILLWHKGKRGILFWKQQEEDRKYYIEAAVHCWKIWILHSLYFAADLLL